MDICKIEGATKVFAAPQGMPDCQSLHVKEADGWMVSQWQPDEDERKTLADGGSVYLWIYGAAHPVVGLTTNSGNGELTDSAQNVYQRLMHRDAEVKLLRLALARLGRTLGDQQRICDIALASTGGQPDAADL